MIRRRLTVAPGNGFFPVYAKWRRRVLCEVLGESAVLVVGAGFGRTGTTSLQAALEHLGFGPCLHGGDFPGHPSRIRAWLTAAREPKGFDWETLLGDYQSGLDWPVAAFWRELMDFYPDAKCILGVRDENSWYDSIAKTLFRVPLAVPTWIRGPFVRFEIATSSWLPPYPAMMEQIVYEGIFNNRLDREGAIEVYRRHTEEVIAALPADRLLVWQPAQGWEPLCAFLEVPVPSEPFPRLNDTESFQRVFRKWPVLGARMFMEWFRTVARRVAPGRGKAAGGPQA